MKTNIKAKAFSLAAAVIGVYLLASPAYATCGINGDRARVTEFRGRVLIRAIDAMEEEAVTIAMTPEQARALAAGIVAAAENAEAFQ